MCSTTGRSLLQGEKLLCVLLSGLDRDSVYLDGLCGLHGFTSQLWLCCLCIRCPNSFPLPRCLRNGGLVSPCLVGLPRSCEPGAHFGQKSRNLYIYIHIYIDAYSHLFTYIYIYVCTPTHICNLPVYIYICTLYTYSYKRYVSMSKHLYICISTYLCMELLGLRKDEAGSALRRPALRGQLQ